MEKNRFLFKIDKNIKYLLAQGDKDDKPQKIVITGGELYLLAQNRIKIKIVLANGYEVKDIACKNYSLVYRTAWQVLDFYEEQGLLIVDKSNFENASNNAIIEITTQKKIEKKRVEKTIVLSEHPFWENIEKGKHIVQIQTKSRIVYKNEFIKEE